MLYLTQLIISKWTPENKLLSVDSLPGEELTVPNYGGELIKRGPRDYKEYISGRGIGYPANRKDLIRFAEGKQAESDVLDLLKGIPEIEYNTPDDVTREIERLESQRTREYTKKEY